jgi:hypothetical protein
MYILTLSKLITQGCASAIDILILPLCKCKKIIYHARQGKCTLAIMVHCTRSFGRTVKTLSSLG